MSWPTKNSIPINSLFYTCIQQTPSYFDLKAKSTNRLKLVGETKLPLMIRQQILDCFVRERIETNVDLICDLLDGGVRIFDLWSICEINSYNDNDVYKILNRLTLNCDHLVELNIGGPEWIYNSQLINGPLMELFANGNLVRLESLKLQQLNNEKMFYEILSNCPNLQKLEIREPSITDQHINRVADRLSIMKFFKLQELTLPSSVRDRGLFDCFQLFSNLRSLSISNFEPVLDYLDDQTSAQHPTTRHSVLKQQLKQLNKLTITNPMGKYAVEQIVRYCPKIRELNLEVQEIMHLKPICKLKSLESLSLHNSPNLPSSFLSEVLPVLENIGHQFISLSLEQFDVLDLVEINKFCPILHSFSAQWFTLLSVGRSSTFRLINESINLQLAIAARAQLNQHSIEHTHRRSKDDFSNLRLLRLRPRVNGSLSSLAIEYIIQNAKKLQYLELYCCKQLNDSLFGHWFKLNDGFKELKYLIIRHCNDLSRTPIARLLANSSNLMFLDLDKPNKLIKTEFIPNSDDPIDLNIIL